MILVGDLGGTHTRLALAELDGNRVDLARVMRYRNSEHANLDAILASFLADSAQCAACCLAVAGPTDGTRVRFTNLDWEIETDHLAERFGFARCSLINDFSAVGWGLNTLTPAALATLQIGQPIAGAAAVALGAGTGLGVSLCAWRGNQAGGDHVGGDQAGGYFQPLASEGGHVSFAPVNSEQDRLLAFLRTLYGRISVERILSGPGLVDLFRFCLQDAGKTSSPLLATQRPAEAISQAGLAQDDPLAGQCLRLFAQIYGQTAGDWALAAQAGGGIYLAGGIAPKLLPVLQSDVFLDAFTAKGRYRDWMAGVPVAVILDPDIGLKGAAYSVTCSDAQSR
jgi:glucokinase